MKEGRVMKERRIDPRALAALGGDDSLFGNEEKCCWYPFKETYTRRRIDNVNYAPSHHHQQPPPPSTQNNVSRYNTNDDTNKTEDVEMQEYNEIAASCTSTPLDHHLNGRKELVLPGKTQKSLFVANTVTGINADCTSKQFWMDEIAASAAAGGVSLWSCAPEEGSSLLGSSSPPLVAAVRTTHRGEHVGHMPLPTDEDIEGLVTPKIEVVHEPHHQQQPQRRRSFGSTKSSSLQRRRSFGSKNSLPPANINDDEKSQKIIRRSLLCGPSQQDSIGDMERLMEQARKERVARGYDNNVIEEKKDEDARSSPVVRHDLDLPELISPDKAAAPRVIRRSKSFNNRNNDEKSKFAAPHRSTTDDYGLHHRERSFPTSKFSVASHPSTPERPRIIRRSKSHSSNQSNRQYSDPRQNRSTPHQFVEVAATRSQLDAVKDHFEDEKDDHNSSQQEKHFSGKLQVVGGEPMSPTPDLEVVRQSSLVDSDSAFMGSERGERSPIGNLLSSMRSKALRRRRSSKTNKDHGTEGNAESVPLSPKTSGVSINKSRKYDAKKTNPASPLTSYSAATSNYSRSSVDGDEYDSTSWESSFKPPHEVSGINEDDEFNDQPGSDPGGLVGNVSNAYSYKKSMSEKVSRRLRSLDRNRSNLQNEGQDNPSHGGDGVVSNKGRSFKRTPISALTTTSDEIYTVTVPKNCPSSPEKLKRDHISEITTHTHHQNVSRGGYNGAASVFGNLMKALSMSADEDEVHEEVSDEDEDTVSASIGKDWSKSELFAGPQCSRPDPEKKFDGMENIQSPQLSRPKGATGVQNNDAVIRSPRSSYPQYNGDSNNSEASPTSHGSQSRATDFFAKDMKSFFEDLSGVGTSAFQGDDDSIFSDLDSADDSADEDESSYFNVIQNLSHATGVTSKKKTKISVTRSEKSRQDKLFRGDMTSDGSSAFQDEFDCMDNWLEYKP